MVTGQIKHPDLPMMMLYHFPRILPLNREDGVARQNEQQYLSQYSTSCVSSIEVQLVLIELPVYFSLMLKNEAINY